MTGFASALRVRSFRRLVVAHGLATVAQLVLVLAVAMHVLERTTSGVWVSVTVALGFAPYALLSSLAGVLADRRSRSGVLAWSAGVRAVLALLVALAALLGTPVGLVVGLAALLAVAATPSYPALAAATPGCVPERDLPAANALVTCVENTTWMAGPGVFGLLLVLGLGPGTITASAAGLFAAAAVAAALVRCGAPVRSAPAGVWRELRVGVDVVARRAEVRRPMVLAVLDNFLYGYLVVAFVVLVEEAGVATSRVGWLNAALTAGALTSMVLVHRVTGGPRAPLVLSAVLTCFAGTVVVLGLVGPNAVGMGVATAAGAATLLAEVGSVTLLQRSVDDGVLARVFGVYDQLNVGAIALGSLAAGPFAAWWGAQRSVAVVGTVCLLLLLPALWVRPRPDRVRPVASAVPHQRPGPVPGLRAVEETAGSAP